MLDTSVASLASPEMDLSRHMLLILGALRYLAVITNTASVLMYLLRRELSTQAVERIQQQCSNVHLLADEALL